MKGHEGHRRLGGGPGRERFAHPQAEWGALIRNTTYRIDPRLATLLEDAEGFPWREVVLDRLRSLVSGAEPAPTGEALRVALRAHLWVLERAERGGIALTQAGYLNPTDLRALAAELPTMEDWPFPVKREVHTQPVFGFREHLRRVGLLRRAKGTLSSTKLGRKLRLDADALWRHLAERLVPRRSGFEETAGLLLLVHAATSKSEHVEVEAVLKALADLGWARGSKEPLEQVDVYDVWNPLWHAIGSVGPAVGPSLDRELSAAAISLVRDALLTQVDDVKGLVA